MLILQLENSMKLNVTNVRKAQDISSNQTPKNLLDEMNRNQAAEWMSCIII